MFDSHICILWETVIYQHAINTARWALGGFQTFRTLTLCTRAFHTLGVSNPIIILTQHNLRHSNSNPSTEGYGYNAELRNADYRCRMHKIPRIAQYFCKIKS